MQNPYIPTVHAGQRFVDNADITAVDACQLVIQAHRVIGTEGVLGVLHYLNLYDQQISLDVGDIEETRPSADGRRA